MRRIEQRHTHPQEDCRIDKLFKVIGGALKAYGRLFTTAGCLASDHWNCFGSTELLAGLGDR